MEVTYALGEQMLVLARVAATSIEARQKLEASITSGAALKKFRDLVAAQGGDARVIDDPAKLPAAKLRTPNTAARSGYITEVDAMGVALAALRLGAGRARAEDKIDHAVGMSELVKIGERIERGAPLAILHANDASALAEAKATFTNAIKIGDAVPVIQPWVHEVIG
jgi:thymidine phosphorylase